jgi:hypothetical protein
MQMNFVIMLIELLDEELLDQPKLEISECDSKAESDCLMAI